MSDLDYLAGFGAAHRSEALPGAVPDDKNSPRRGPYGLLPEQVNGTAFTVPRQHNLRSWLYRIRPSVNHGPLERCGSGRFGIDYLAEPPDPNLIGWHPRPPAGAGGPDFVDSLETVCGAGDPALEHGLAFHTYAAGSDMVDRAFYDADGDLMIVPDTGRLRIRTELGLLDVAPGEIAVVPRGLLLAVSLPDGPARGFVAEAYARHFELPGRGPIGANGLADERHFLYPVAAYEDREVEFEIAVKTGGRLWRTHRAHSPFDVVGWHGRYAPYKYDLSLFNGVGTVTWDHPDPSIFTVLSAPLDHAGENLCDLVVFPNPRWDVAWDTFRPPFFHRNTACEVNAIITGPSRADDVFSRGGLFVTPPLTAHGSAITTVDRWLEMSDDDGNAPRKLDSSSLWIQWETTLPLRFARWAMDADYRAPAFRSFASPIRSRFDPNQK